MSATLWLLWLCLLAPEPPADLAAVLATAPTAAEQAAPAIWLRRERGVTWHDDGRVERTLRGTLKVLRGTLSAYEVDLGYFGDQQKVTVVAARTWHPRRGLVDLQAVALQRAQLGPFDEVDHLWLQFPTLDADSLLDYEVRLDDLQPSQPEGLTDQWQLGAREPVLEARYAARVPAGRPLDSDPKQFSHPVTVRTVGTAKEYVWRETDLPRDSEQALLVSTVTDWNQVATRYRQAAAGQYRRHAALEAAVAREIAGQADPAKALYHYVVSQIAYREGTVETGAPGIEPRPATETFDLRVGDCKDMTTLLITMLGRAGIVAYPALLRTLGRGVLVESVPAMAQFDHVVVAVPQGNGYRWFDPTWRFGPADYAPPKIQGVQALVVTDQGARWSVVPIPPGSDNFRRRAGEFALAANGEISGSVEVTAGGALEQALRYAVARGGTRGVEQELSAQLALTLEPGSVEASPPEAMAKPLALRYRLARQAYARGGPLLLLRCAVIERATMPRALSEAHGPVRLDVAPRETEDRLRFKLAPGLTVRQLPGELGQKAPWGSWRVTHRLTGDTIEYVRTVSLTRPLLAESQVPEAVRWYRELVAADNDTLVVLERR